MARKQTKKKVRNGNKNRNKNRNRNNNNNNNSNNNNSNNNNSNNNSNNSNITRKCRKDSNNLNRLEGKKAPIVKLQGRKRDETVDGPNKFSWYTLSTKNIYKGKRIIIFALPGAFTPTCSSTHLPGFEKNYRKILKLGVDEIYCLSVNDAFVMFNWCKTLKVKNVKPLPDGNGQFTKKMGALVHKKNLGFGARSWRYSMVVNNGKIEKVFTERGMRDNCSMDPFEVSDANTMMEYLEETKSNK